MAPKNKENGTRPPTRTKAVKIVSLPDPESSEEDYRKKRDKNNQVWMNIWPTHLDTTRS